MVPGAAAAFALAPFRVPEAHLVALQVDVKQHAHRHEARQKTRTAVRDEGQRDAGDRHDAHRHTDVDEDLEQQHRLHILPQAYILLI